MENKEQENVEIVKKGEFDSTPFNIISKSEILTKKDIDKLIPLTQELKETFLKAQVFRTRTEMEISILNDIKHPTPSSKYWQATREQDVMFNELVMLSYNYRKALIKMKLKKEKMDKEEHPLKKELIQVDIEKAMFMLKNQEKIAKERIRELQAWSEIKTREAGRMSESELADVDNHQLISYTQRWIKQSMEMGAGGSPSERQNLFGQLRSGILGCIEKGVISDVLKEFSKEVQDQIKGEYNIQ